MISTVILSAGQSRRFGSPKALATINNTTAIEFIQHKLLNSPVDEIIVVLGHQPEVITPHIIKNLKIKVVHNTDYEMGQLSSIKCGLGACSNDSSAAFVWPVDCPFISLTTIATLVNKHEQNLSKNIIPTNQGRKGHPPLLTAEQYKDIFNTPIEHGLNNLLNENNSILVEINDNGILKTFNTPEELKKLNV